MKKGIFLLALSSSLLLCHCNGIDGPTQEILSTDEAGNDVSEIVVDQQKQVINDQSGGDGTVSLNAGYASDGTVLSIPGGFAIDRCVFTASPATIDGSAISIVASVNTTTGLVSCKKVVQERTEIPAETQGCVASFSMLCVK